MSTEQERKDDYKEAHKIAWAGWGPVQMQAKADLKAYSENTWTPEDRLKFKKADRELMSFPLIRRHIKLISGYQRKNRASLRYEPVEAGDMETAQIFTAAGMWALQLGNGLNIVSDAFEGALITGINLVNLYNDRNQNTYFDRFFYNQFLLDPNFSYRDLRDCHFGILRKYVTKDAAKMLLWNKDNFIEELAKKKPGTQDGLFSNYKAPTLYGEKLLAYDEFQRRTTKEQIILINRITSKETEWRGTKKDLDALFYADPSLPLIFAVDTRRVPTIEVTSYLQDEEVSNGIDPFGIGDFSFTPIMAFWHPEHELMIGKLQSVVHGMVDAQRASDKRMMSMISMFEQQIGGGLDFEEDTLVDEDDAFASGQKPRQFKKGALQNQRARDRVVPDIPTGMFQLHQLFSELMTKSVNINEELLGDVVGNPKIAGVLAQFRAGQALVGLQDLFDNLGLGFKVIGNKLLKLLQQYTASRIQRITNTQPTREFYTGDFGKYDATPVQGMSTDTQRSAFYQELVQLKEMGAKIGEPLPFSWSFVLRNASLAMPKEMMAEINRYEQEQSQSKQKAEKLAMIKQQLEIELIRGNVMANRGIAEERRSQAVENQSDAALNRAKTAAEIDDIGIGRIIELVQMAIDLESVGQQNVKAEAKS